MTAQCVCEGNLRGPVFAGEGTVTVVPYLEVTRWEYGVSLHRSARGQGCPLSWEQCQDPETGSDAPPPSPHVLGIPAPTPTRPTPGQCLRHQSPLPRLTQQRPQVLQTGQHVLLGVQHLLGGLLHIPVALSGEHPAAGSPGPTWDTRRRLRRASHRTGSRLVLNARAHLRAAAASAVTPGRRGGHREGRGRKAVSRRNQRPRPPGGASLTSRAASAWGRSWLLQGAPRGAKEREVRTTRHKETCPYAFVVLQFPECTAIEPSNQTVGTLARWESGGRL